MSIPWQIIRGAHIDPSAIKFTDLQNKQNMFENQLFSPPTAQLKIISADTHDRLAYYDNLFFGKVKYKNSQYFMPYEPDGNILRLWLRYNHLGREIRDFSNWCNDFAVSVVLCHGAPRLCRGPDDGIKGGRVVTRFNAGVDNDYLEVLNPEESNIGVQSQTLGFSMYHEFMAEGDLSQQQDVDQTIWAHTDDPGGDYGSLVQIGADGRFKFFIRDNGVNYNFITAPNKITPGHYYSSCLTYNPTGNVLTMRLNNVTQTDVINETPEFPDPIDNSVYISSSGVDIDDASVGKFIGRIADTRWYRHLIFNGDHQDNIWNNKRSICAVNVLDFNGVDGWVDLGAQTSIWSKNITKFSCAFWVRFDTITNDYQNIMTIGDGTNDIDINMLPTPNTLAFDMTKDGYGTEGLVTTTLNTTNKWYYIAATFDKALGSQHVKLYLDALLKGTANYAFTIAVPATAHMFLGHYFSDGSSFNHDGQIKDFKWWDAVALTQEQIVASMLNRSDAPTPSYWLKLNEGYDVPVDSITRTKKGTLNGGATWKIGSSPRPIEFGKIDVMGYSRFNSQIFTAGYDAVGYDSTGFDTS